jgi:hypothetical protein
MSGHDHDACACGKNGTAEAHGYEYNVQGPISRAAGGGYAGRPTVVTPLSCDDVNAIRARVAADLTRDSMNPIQRATAWAQGRSGEYTEAAYDAAWAPATPAVQVDGSAR